MRRREAEELLHGFRGFYGESFASWSPRHAKKNSLGHFSFGAEDALRDPRDDSSRRETSFSQMECDSLDDRDDSSRYSKRFVSNPLDPTRGDFLIDGRHYDGTRYIRTEQDMEVSSGVSMFSPRSDPNNRFRDRPPLSTRSSMSGRRPFFKSPTSASGGKFESDAPGFTSTPSSEFAVEFDENEFRETPPTTTRSSMSGGKSFFKSATSTSSRNLSKGFTSSLHEPRRKKLHTPISAASNGDFNTTSDGFLMDFDENNARRFEQNSDDQDFRESAISATSPYEPPQMKTWTPNGASGESFDRNYDGFPAGFDRSNTQNFNLTSENSEDREPADQDFRESATSATSPYEPPQMKTWTPNGASGESFDRNYDGFSTGFDRSNTQSFKLTSEDSEDREPATSPSTFEARRRSHDPSGESAPYFKSNPNSASDGFDGNAPNGEQRTSEDPEGRKSVTYKEQRMKLQVKTQREEVIDVKASEERLREAEDEDLVGSWRTERQEISYAPSEDSTVSCSQRAAKSVQKIPETAVLQELKKEAVPETIWRGFISDEPGAKFPPEAGRYHLYASYACPGSHRALIVRALKGLEDIVSVTIVHPTWRQTNPDDPKDKHRGWIFGDPDGKPFHNTMGRGGPFPPAYQDTDPDPVMDAYSVRNLYEYAKDTSGKYTIPLLWDTKLNTIVNNESSDISYMLNSCFNTFSKEPELDLYTEDDDQGLDRLNEVSQWLYPMMIHGVYRCGFAKTQKTYDRAIEELTAAFDAADALLQDQRYLTGDTLTDADIRFFVTLLRFDEVYAFYFRANTRLVLMTPSLLNFCREIYQMPGVAGTCQMDQIKAHFFGSHAEWNKYSIVPRGLDFMRYLEMPHDRERIASYGHI